MKWVIRGLLAFFVGAFIAYTAIAAPKVSEKMLICTESAGITSHIQKIRQIEVEKDQTHAFEDFKKDIKAPILVILGDYVFHEYDADVDPDFVHDDVLEKCMNGIQIKRSPPNKEGSKPKYEV